MAFLAYTGMLFAQNCQSSFSFGETGITIDFFDESTSNAGDPVVSWNWDFEEGSSSQQNPTFTFSEPDDYEVCLTITTQSGCTSTSCVDIETCVLSVNVSVGDCDANNDIPITINISDPYDAARDINISIDGVLVNGSPFRIRDDEPIVINTTVPGDGLNHTVLVNSEDVGTCSAEVTFMVPDCTSDCFLSSLSISSSGGTTHTVDVGDDFFSPNNLTITVGDMVDFVWVGDGHSTTSDATSGPDSWNSGVIGFGSNYQVNIVNPGVHRYYCIPHGGPNGTGMSGILVANCPGGGQFSLNLSFTTSLANAAGYQVLVDGNVVSQNNYNGTGTQNTSIPMAGDGQQHTIEIQDINDPSCILSRNYLAPDCGAAPACSLQVSAVESGACNASDQVPVTLTISAINAGSSGFTVLINGNSVGTYSYDPSGTTTVTVNAPGNGQVQDIVVRDNDDNTCSGTTSITTTNCTIPCSISNLTALTGSSTTHTVEVRDFDFSPVNLTITAGDVVEWLWTGAIAHTSTSDATSGADSWDSGLLNTGATYTSPVLSAGLHPYYCIPHGAPGGVGMAGTITVQADCTNGEVAVGITFSAQGGSFNGYEILVDGVVASSGAYDASGENSSSVLVPGDGQSHTITIRDADDTNCSASTSITTPDCNASTCSLSLTATENGGCNGNDEVPVLLTVSDVGGSASGFTVTVDGAAAGNYSYSGTGNTAVTINVAGDGQFHTITINDLTDGTCTASTEVQTRNCTIPCELNNLQLTVAGENGGIVHEVEVRDFEFVPAFLNLNLGDTARFVWTGVVPHTTTSDVTSGPDSWDSALLGQGAVFDVVPTTTGTHPYYCIPHGAPGGVGMAGTLMVAPPCENGMATVEVSFTAVGNSNAYRLWVDGQQYPGSPFSYTGTNNTQLIQLEGDGQSHLIQVRDFDNNNCFVQDAIALPDCGGLEEPCTLDLVTTILNDCNGDGQVEIGLNLTHANQGSAFMVLLDGTPITNDPIPYSLGGTTTTSIWLNGTGSLRTITVIDQDSVACVANSEILLPDCQIECLITNLQVASGPVVHTVLVEDFVFTPSQLDINVGDTVRYVWTGIIPHTTTSDATSGADAWNSGLLGQGATYDVIIQTEGDHPYYCIPHGGPGGIGMAGNITATKTCNNGQGVVDISFNVSNGSPLGYRVFVDGVFLAGPLLYGNSSGENTTLIEVEGDAASHILTIQDMEVNFCAASTTFIAPDCPAICLVGDFLVTVGSQIVHTVAVEDFVFEPSFLQARVGETIRFVWMGEVPHTTTSDATTGPNTWDSGLLGQGSVYELVLTEPGLHPYYCTPHGGPGGIGMAGMIEALPACEDSLASYQLRFNVSNGSDQGYRVFVGGVLLPGSPFPYDDPTGLNVRDIQYPSYGQQLVITVQDVETPFCAATRSILAPDCSPQCDLAFFTQGNWECGDATATIDLGIVAQNTGSGFRVLVDGVEQENSPYTYSGDTTIVQLFITNDGLAHEVTIEDLEAVGCQFSQMITADCLGECGFNITDLAIGGNTRHEVQVRDFDFLPLQLQVEVGDTVHFIWTGEVPHTVTSDTNEGLDVWNSGLLGNGAEFEVVIQSAGEHPYYCIPHGAPGGIGMAANITAVEECADEVLNVVAAFSLSYPQGDGFQVLIDNEFLSEETYQAGNQQIYNFSLPGDGGTYLLSLLDNTAPGCRLDTLIKMPDCNDVCFGVTADYSYALTPTPFTYQFTDLSTGEPDSWQWDFGDGTMSSLANPAHTFPGSGDYEVCLIITNESLVCQDTICQIVSLGTELCEANFTYEIDGLNVAFSDQSLTSSAITGWQWSFPGGVQITGNPTPSFTFPALANYEVCLSIETAECTSTYCDSIDLSDPCLLFNADFAVQNGNGLEMLFIDQTSGTPNQWLWGFGDGSTSTQQFPAHEYAADGVYRVCLLVQDIVNNCNSVHCIDQVVGTVATRELHTGKSLIVFPNPAATSTQQWQLTGWEEAAIGQEMTIRILQMNGQSIHTTRTIISNTITIDLPRSLPPGVYLIEAKGERQLYLGKMVVQ